MRMNKYVYHFVFLWYIYQLIFIFLLCLNIKVLLLLQVKFTGWVNYLIPLGGLLSQPGIWVGVCHGNPGSLSPFVYNIGSNL